MRKASVWLITLCLLWLPIRAAAQAVTAHTSVDIAVDQKLYDPCTGEMFDETGSIHFDMTVTVDAKGGMHVRSHTNDNGDLVAIGETSGAQYRIVGQDNTTSNFALAGTVEIQQTIKMNIIAPNGASNYLQLMVFRSVANPSGVTIPTLVRIDIKCTP